MIRKSERDYRHCMCCQDCWAFFMDESVTPRCRITLEGTNRPDGISPDRTRLGFFVHEWSLMEKWPCEYRYTSDEIEMMQAGKLKDIHVTKKDAARVLEKVTEDMSVWLRWGY